MTEPKDPSVPVRERHAVRALLRDPHQRVLLIKLFVPDTGRYVWLTPGGGIEGSESAEQALQREVWEETGLQLQNNTGTHVWNRSAEFTFRGERLRQHEQFYLVEVAAFEPRGDLNPADNESELLSEFRWWSAGDIQASSDYFAPRQLGNLLNALNQALPETPLSVGW